ncbi:metal-dependent transcriptional regulator [Levilactobacillus brevis]|uniref:metal-dependent transcriptional regulator n=1 Tax=Levilactobacillus brevis TaxID=1580 RepID=UPI001BA992C4|nr:metal-dependent transcriptional regulator [Levilactobacillus brevis]MBS0979083.1 metal-dependent transcriptional regulator [Levilactobacillus brevis]
MTYNTYIKIIAECNFSRSLVSYKQIVKFANVSPATVNEMTRHLQQQGLVNRYRYTGVVITKKGKQLAKKLLYNYRLCEVFLAQQLKIPLVEIPVQAWKMSDTLEIVTVSALEKILEYPQRSPFGGSMKTDLLNDETVVRLNQLPERATAVLVSYLETPSLVKYMNHINLSIDDFIYVKFHDSDLNLIYLENSDHTEMVINSETAEYLYVRQEPKI